MDWPFRLTRRLFLALTGGAAAALRPSGAPANEFEEKALTAEEILRKVAETYRTCQTYQDSGTRVVVFRHADGARTNTRSFTTAFTRPDRINFVARYRFHDSTPWHHNIVWSSGSDVRCWRDGEKQSSLNQTSEKPTTIIRALQRIAGMAAPDVALLLFPGQPGEWWRLTELTKLRRLEDSQLGDLSCFRVEGRLALPWEANPTEKERQRRAVERSIREKEQRGEKPVWRPPDLDTIKRTPRVIWIDRATFLVRRIEDFTHFETFSTESTTNFEPVVDAPVSEEQLAFVEPVYPERPIPRLEAAPEKPDDWGGSIPFVAQSTVNFTV